MLRSPFTKFICATGSPHCMMPVATAVVLSDTFVVASIFEKSYCKCLICRLQQWGTLQVLLLHSLERPGHRQLNHNLNSCTCSLRLFSFIEEKLLKFQMACGHSGFFSFVDFSALDSDCTHFCFFADLKHIDCLGLQIFVFESS